MPQDFIDLVKLNKPPGKPTSNRKRLFLDSDFKLKTVNPSGVVELLEDTTSVTNVVSGGTGTNGTDGADGADGEQGEQGPQGEQGEQGPQGDPGADGADGADGPAGAPAITPISIYDDYFDGTSLDPKWTTNITSGLTVRDGALHLVSTAGPTFKVLTQAFINPGTFIISSANSVSTAGTGGGDNIAGVIVRNSATGNTVVYGYGYNISSNRWFFARRQTLSGTNANLGDAVGSEGGYAAEASRFEYRIRSDGTTLSLEWSKDGDCWNAMYTEAIASWVSTIDTIGIFTSDNVTGCHIPHFKVRLGAGSKY